MARYLLFRILGAMGVLFFVVSLVFAILRLTGDPLNMMIPFGATPQEMALFRRSLDLDKPLHIQYLKFLAGIPTLNMGISFRYKEPAMELVMERIPATLELALTSLAIALVLSIPLGVLAAIHRNSAVDNIISFVSFFGYSMPQFWLGTMLILLFAVRLGWLPTSGSGGLEHLILPSVTLATWPLGQFTRLIRSEMLEILSKDYIRTARAKGLSELRVLLGHALRSAAIPLITLGGLSLGIFMGGDILVESVFAWPGMGRLAVQAVSFRDFPLVQASVIVFAGGLVSINLLVDVLYAIVDPRIELH